MKLNQFESSISFIHNTLPGFIRGIYEKFIVLENELYSQLNTAFQTNPYSVNSFIKDVIYESGPQFIQMCKYIMSKENQIYLQKKILEYCTEEVSYTIYKQVEDTKDEFNAMPGGDINAPIRDIQGFVSSFPFSINTSVLPVICIEPVVQGGCGTLESEIYGSNKAEYNSKRYDTFWDYRVYDEVGNVQLLENVFSRLKIDIDHVLTYFFYTFLAITVNYIRYSREEKNFWESYTEFHDKLNNDADDTFVKEREEILNKYIAIVEGSAILTYMSYGGKLIGAKGNMLDWLYNTFIKETVSDIEQGEYQKNVDITAFSGQQLYNTKETDVVKDNFIQKAELDNQKALKKVLPSGDIVWNTNLIYKNLRLNYSNWCTTINAIANIDKGKGNCHYYKDTYFAYCGKDVDGYLQMANHILSEYISHYYATYNVFVYPNPDEPTFNDAGFFMDFVANRIINKEIKVIIRDSSKYLKRIQDYFIDSTDVLGILKSIGLVKNCLADIFMTYTYIIMLNGLYNSQSSILDEKDALTGKSKKELFNEIYAALVNKVNEYFRYGTRIYLYQDIIIYNGATITYEEWKKGIYSIYNNTLANIFTPIENFRYRYEIKNNVQIDALRDALKNIKSPITFTPPYTESPDRNDESIIELLTELYDIHPISVIADLSVYHEKCGKITVFHDAVTSANPTSSYSRTGHIFPRNRITNDLINQTRLYEPKMFKSLEDASDIIDKAKEDSSIGNNANYSAIGGLGGSVTDEENVMSKGNEEPVGENSIQFLGNESYNPNSIQLNNLIDSWNDLFNKTVLGGKNITVLVK
jgi:hypothetical protein